MSPADDEIKVQYDTVELHEEAKDFLAAKRTRGYWMAAVCEEEGSPKCVFQLGNSDDFENPLFNFEMDNPWAPIRYAEGSEVNYLTFTPMTRETNVYLRAICTAMDGDYCTLDSDCRKSDASLKCNRSKCEK